MSDILSVLLAKYQVRRTKKQKDDFIVFVKAAAHSAGYPCEEEVIKGSILLSRNLIAGDPEKAKVVFTAHYDTCARLPFPNLVYPQNKILTILAQMPLILILLALAFGTAYLTYGLWGRVGAVIAAYIVYFGLFSLVFFGPANKHTANDNTSGVAALLQIMNALPAGQKQNAAFIFFDNEEYGKVGSKAFAKKHPDLMADKTLLNMDCVGDGDDLFIVAPKNADEPLLSLLRAAFQDADGKRAVHCSAKNTNYNSDQKSFPSGVAVAACRKGPFGYHIPRIHTRRDVICEESNLNYVTACAMKLMALISE
ncbi:MAG: M28 family peptidase [Clostridia bacterium]|nr:M28 family peptidase [Clostridia bacterium]